MINLLPNKIREQRKYGRINNVLRNVSITFIGMAIAVNGVLLWANHYILSQEDVVNAEISELKTAVSKLQNDTKSLGELSVRVNNAHKLYKSNILFSELIPKIGSLLPKGSNLTALNLTGGSYDPIKLNFELTSPDIAPTVRQNLFTSDIFEAADIKSITNNVGDEEDTRYKANAVISVSFTGSAEAKAKEAAKLKAAIEARKKSKSGGSN